MELLVYLNRAYFETAEELVPDVVENQKINAVVEYINRHLDADLSLDALAGRFYVSKYHLSRQFKQYITKKRLMTARGMLRRGQPVRSAYLESGFNDYANFSKAFKAEFGLSPKDYVRQL